MQHGISIGKEIEHSVGKQRVLSSCTLLTWFDHGCIVLPCLFLLFTPASIVLETIVFIHIAEGTTCCLSQACRRVHGGSAPRQQGDSSSITIQTRLRHLGLNNGIKGPIKKFTSALAGIYSSFSA